MIEKVNPMHPDKVADRIAGALVDYAYSVNDSPKIAVEVLAGHGRVHIIAETSVEIPYQFVESTVARITKRDDLVVDYEEVPQDPHLAENQQDEIRAGDNGIFKGLPLTAEQKDLSAIARYIYNKYSFDGKYILDKGKLTICHSNTPKYQLEELTETVKFFVPYIKEVVINPLGDWTGGIDVDTGATNRKLGSDMADSLTGGGLHGKDLSKADVSVNIYCFLLAQQQNRPVELSCSIGDTEIGGVPYSEITAIANKFINDIGGYEKLAEWGLF